MTSGGPGVTHNTCADWIYGGQPEGGIKMTFVIMSKLSKQDQRSIDAIAVGCNGLSVV